MSETSLSQAELVVRTIAQTAVDNETYFCELDAVVGDGDFGYSLARGFEVVISDWDGTRWPHRHQQPAQEDRDRPHQADRRHLGADLGDSVPARRGALNDVPDPSGEQVIAAMRASIEGIKQRGNTDLGDKTLLDALVPATDELEKALPEGPGVALQRAAAVARESAEATNGMLAQRGRASYTGERSRGSVDAGAVGIAVMFEAVSTAWQESELERA